MMRFPGKVGVLVGLALLLLFGAGRANAQINIAVFGDNATDDFINNQMPGYSATLVTLGQLETPGFLNSFSAFYYTRNTGQVAEAPSLSALAAANVIEYVGIVGNIVLLNGDFADSLPGTSAIPGGDPNIMRLTANAVTFAASSGRGYIGELSGAVSALTGNADFFTPLNLIPGFAGPLGFEQGGSFGSLVATPLGLGSPVLAGVTLPYNPPDVEFGAELTGVPDDLVIARWENGNPAIIARVGIPEPGTLALFGSGLLGLVGMARRRRK